jgi:hypothetical protein
MFGIALTPANHHVFFESAKIHVWLGYQKLELSAKEERKFEDSSSESSDVNFN